MNYSFDTKGEDVVKAQSYDINASYKDLGAVCTAIRYMKVQQALGVLEGVMTKEMAIEYFRHNKHMGSRHELGGNKGGYPIKAAAEVKKTLENAIANASNVGKDGADMYIIGAAANKTRIERRYPSKGSIAWGRGMYGMSATNHSDIEYAKIEIVLVDEFSNKITKNMKYFIKKKSNESATESKAAAQKKQVKPAATKPKQVAVPAAEDAKPKLSQPAKLTEAGDKPMESKKEIKMKDEDKVNQEQKT